MSASAKLSRTRAILAALLLLSTSGSAVAQSSDRGWLGLEGGRRWFVDRVTDIVERLAGGRVQIGDIQGAMLGNTTLIDVKLLDHQGVWATVDRLAFDWAPTALLRRRLEIDRLAAEGIHVLRRPEGGDQPASASPPRIEPPELPVALTVKSFSATPVRLDRAVLGVPARLEARGSLRLLGRESNAVELVVERKDAAERLLVDIGHRPQENRLAVELKLDAPEGGLVPRALGLPGAPAMMAVLDAEAPLSDWAGLFTLDIGGRGCLTTDVRVAQVEALRLGLEGTGNPACLPGPEYERALGTTVAVSAETVWDLATRLEIERFRLKAQETEAEAQGILDLSPAAFDGRLRVVAPHLDRFAPLAPVALGGALRFEGEVSGPLAAPQVVADVSLERPLVADVAADAADLSVRLVPTGEDLGLVVNGVVADLTVAGAAPVPGFDNTLTVLVDASLAPSSGDVLLRDAQLVAPPATINAQGTISAWGVGSDLAIRARLEAPPEGLGEASGLKGLEGQATLVAQVSGNLVDGPATARLEGQAHDLRTGIAAANALLGNSPSLQAVVTRTPDEEIAVPDLRVEGRAGTLAGRLALRQAAIDGRLRLTVPSLAALEPVAGVPLSGEAAITADFGGTIEAPSIDLAVASPGAAVSGTDLAAVDVAATVRDLRGDPKGVLQGGLRVEGVPVEARTAYRLADGVLHLNETRAASGGGSVTGRAAIDLADRIARGRFEGDVPNLDRWAALFGGEASGAVRFAARFERGARGGQFLALDAQGTDVSLADAVRAGTVTLDASLDNVLAEPVGRAELVVRNAVAAGVPLSELQATAEGAMTRLVYRVQAEGTRSDPLSLTAMGTVTGGATGREGLVLRVETLDGRVRAVPVGLARPLTLRLRDDRLAVEDIALRIADGRLSGRLIRAGQRLDGGLELADLPLSLLDAVDVVPAASGTLSGSLGLDGTVSRPEARLSLVAREVRLREATLRDAPPLAAEFEAVLRDGRLRTTAAVAAASDFRLDAQGSVPVRASLQPFRLEPIDDAPITGTATGAGDIGRIAGVLPLGENRIDGRLALRLEMSGTLAAPDVAGEARLDGGYYENLVYGTLIRDLVLEARAEEGGSGFVVEGRGTDGAGGRIVATGRGRLRPDLGFEGTVRLQEMYVSRSGEVIAQADGEIAVAGTPETISVRGDLTAVPVDIRIPDRLPPKAVDLDVRQINVPPRERRAVAKRETERRAAADGEAAVTVPLGISLDMPRRFFVRGRGLDSEWQGRLEVTGTAGEPLLVGTLDLVRGTFDALGRTVRLERGRITFDQAPGNDPLVDITGTVRANEITATIQVQGRASEPTVDLSSDPPLPSDEIIARLLFGRSGGQLTTAQQLQLAQAAASLAAGGGPGVLDAIRRRLGVDVLEVSSEDGEAGPGVSVGKYITEDINVIVDKGLRSEDDRVRVEIRVTPRVSVETAAGRDAGSSIGLNWRFDY